jgi:arabinose-5-phosphate isomerase
MTTMDPAQLASSPAEFLRHEARAIEAAAERIDSEAFGRAAEILAGCTGTVATAGAGTSGIVARKIAATLTSTGTPAVFVHPSDALHGGLGVIGAQEVVIAISNSGETDELSALMPYLRRREVPVIAIVGNLRSTLAEKSTVALDAHAEREAGSLNLVPTASVAVALALGDALALTVMEMKGVTSERFAENHPSGRLGRRLTLTVSDVMHGGGDLPSVLADTPLLEVVSAISGGGLGAVPVVDGDGRLAGIVTDGDLRRALERSHATHLTEMTAADVMTAAPIVVEDGTMAYDALRVMEDRPSQIAVLPVVDGERRCIGIVRLHDLARIGL